MAQATRVVQSDIAGVTASADLSAAAKLGTVVKIGSTGLTATTCGAGEKGDGILVNSPESGDPIDIMCYGVIDARVDGNAGAIAVGSWLISNATGQLVASTTDTDVVLAKSLGISTAAGDIIPVLWGPFTLSV